MSRGSLSESKKTGGGGAVAFQADRPDNGPGPDNAETSPAAKRALAGSSSQRNSTAGKGMCDQTLGANSDQLWSCSVNSAQRVKGLSNRESHFVAGELGCSRFSEVSASSGNE